MLLVGLVGLFVIFSVVAIILLSWLSRVQTRVQKREVLEAQEKLKENMQRDIKERADFEDQKDAIFKIKNKSFVRVELTKDIKADGHLNKQDLDIGDYRPNTKIFERYSSMTSSSPYVWKVTLYKGESGHINDELNKLSIGGIVSYVEPGDFKLKEKGEKSNEIL